MKKTTLYKLLIFLFAINLNAQENVNIEMTATEKLLIGEWKFIKTVDENNNTVKFITKEYKDPFGKNIQVVAKGPEIKLNSDHTYRLQFTEVNSDTGFWKLIAKNKIAYQMTTLKDSDKGEMIVQAQNKLNVKWDIDKDGNFVDTATDEIISVSENELKIRYEKKYIFIYKKK